MIRGFVKTLFGDIRTVLVCGACILIAALLLRTPLAPAAGVVVPCCFLSAVRHLARH